MDEGMKKVFEEDLRISTKREAESWKFIEKYEDFIKRTQAKKIKKVKVGQIVEYRDYARLETCTGKVICISKVQDCLYEQYKGEILLHIKEERNCPTTKVWLYDVIGIKEGDTDV